MGLNLPDTVIKQLYCQKKAKWRNHCTGAISKSRVFGSWDTVNSCQLVLSAWSDKNRLCARSKRTQVHMKGCEVKRLIWWNSSHHKYSKWPPVRALRVPSPVDDLWSHVLYCSTEGICSFIMVDGLFTQSKVWNRETARQRRGGTRSAEGLKWSKRWTEKAENCWMHWPVILMCPSSSRRILLGEQNRKIVFKKKSLRKINRYIKGSFYEIVLFRF